MATIKVKTILGEQEFSKDQYVKRWTDWSVDFGTICDTSDDWKRYRDLQALTKELAGKSFDAALSKDLAVALTKIRDDKA